MSDTINNSESTKENLHEIERVQKRVRQDLNSLEWNIKEFYTQAWETVKYNLDVAKTYLTSIKDDFQKCNCVTGIMAVQILLESQNYNVGKIDWIVGKNTRQALKQFQEAHKDDKYKLTVDGIIGPKTVAALLELEPNNTTPELVKKLNLTWNSWRLDNWVTWLYEKGTGDNTTSEKIKLSNNNINIKWESWSVNLINSSSSLLLFNSLEQNYDNLNKLANLTKAIDDVVTKAKNGKESQNTKWLNGVSVQWKKQEFEQFEESSGGKDIEIDRTNNMRDETVLENVKENFWITAKDLAAVLNQYMKTKTNTN